MNIVVIIEIVFSLTTLICALIFFVYVFQNDEIDYDKWVSFYRNQKSKVLEEIKKGNKRIDEIEENIKNIEKAGKIKVHRFYPIGFLKSNLF